MNESRAPVPRKGEVVRVTAPPPNEIVIARVGTIREPKTSEYEIIDTTGARWAILPRDLGDADHPPWEAIERLTPERPPEEGQARSRDTRER
jgi:hypothetical protein